MAIVYEHRRNDTNEIFYIGIGKFERRAYIKTRKNNKHWTSIVKKYGHTVTVTHRDLIKEDACLIEKYLIDFYGRKDLGRGSLVNKTDGGEINLNRVVSEEARKKFALINKGRKHDASRIEAQRLRLTGRKLSEETKKQIGLSQKGKIIKNESVVKMLETRNKTYEYRKLNGIKTCRVKKKLYNLGKIVLNLTNGVFYDSAQEASDIYGYKYSTLKSMLNGYRKNKTNLIYT